jgi:hypothetical protein
MRTSALALLTVVSIACGDDHRGDPDAGPPGDAAADASADAGADAGADAVTATLTGSLRLAGLTSHEGVTVRFEPGGAAAVTDAAGAFALTAPVGEGRLVIERDGHHEEVPRVVVSAAGSGIRDGDAVHAIVDLEVPRARRVMSGGALAGGVASPDGQRAAFLGPCDGCAERVGRLHALRLDQGDVIDLDADVHADDLAAARWAGDRLLVFERSGDARFLRLYGDGAASLARLEASSFEVTRAGDRAVVGTPDGVEWLDLATGARTVLFRAAARSRTAVDLSPDERLVAFWTEFDGIHGHLHIVPSDGSGEAVTLGARADSWYVVYAPGGDRVFYRTQDHALWSSPTRRADILQHARRLHVIQVSGDGATLVTSERRADAHQLARITMIDARTGAATIVEEAAVPNGAGGFLERSATGSFVCYLVQGQAGYQLTARAVAGGAARPIGPPSRDYHVQPFFTADDRFLLSVSSGALYATELATGQTVALHADVGTGPGYVATSDGRFVFFVAGGMLHAFSSENRTATPLLAAERRTYHVVDDATLLTTEWSGSNPMSRVRLPTLAIELLGSTSDGATVRRDGSLVFTSGAGFTVVADDGTQRAYTTGAIASYQYVAGARYAIYTTYGVPFRQFHILDLDTGARRDFGDYTIDMLPSPDGTRVAFVRDSVTFGVPRVVYVADLAGGPAVAIMSHAAPRWIGRALVVARSGSPPPFGFQDGGYLASDHHGAGL